MLILQNMHVVYVRLSHSQITTLFKQSLKWIDRGSRSQRIIYLLLLIKMKLTQQTADNLVQTFQPLKKKSCNSL